jgi:hypothetical protein
VSEINSKFVIEFDRVQGDAHSVNLANGWWDERTKIDQLCHRNNIEYWPHLAIELIGLHHTELSEAVEAARKHPIESWGDYKTKDTMVRELAGCVVRIMDMAENFGLPVGRAIEAEIEANRGRGHMHGGKKA